VSFDVINRVRYCSAAEGSALLVLLLLADQADEFGECYPGEAHLAASARLSGRRVRAALAELRRLGEVEVVERGCGLMGRGKAAGAAIAARASKLRIVLPDVPRDEKGRPCFRTETAGSNGAATGRARPEAELCHRTNSVLPPDEFGLATGRNRPPNRINRQEPQTPLPPQQASESDQPKSEGGSTRDEEKERATAPVPTTPPGLASPGGDGGPATFEHGPSALVRQAPAGGATPSDAPRAGGDRAEVERLLAAAGVDAAKRLAKNPKLTPAVVRLVAGEATAKRCGPGMICETLKDALRDPAALAQLVSRAAEREHARAEKQRRAAERCAAAAAAAAAYDAQVTAELAERDAWRRRFESLTRDERGLIVGIARYRRPALRRFGELCWGQASAVALIEAMREWGLAAPDAEPVRPTLRLVGSVA